MIMFIVSWATIYVMDRCYSYTREDVGSNSMPSVLSLTLGLLNDLILGKKDFCTTAMGVGFRKISNLSIYPVPSNLNSA